MVTLQLMIATLLAPVGRKRVLEAFEYFKTLSGESSCYQSLVQLLTEQPVNPFLQVFILWAYDDYYNDPLGTVLYIRLPQCTSANCN